MVDFGKMNLEHPVTPLEGYFRLNRFCFGRGESREPVDFPGIRDVYLNVNLRWKWKWSEIRQLVDYSGFGMHKMGQLKRTYLREEELDLCIRRIKSRRKEGTSAHFISVGMNFGTGAKNKEEQTGECIAGMGFYLTRQKGFKDYMTAVHVFFRQSEVTRRFIGDLMFIDWVASKVLGESPDEVRMSIGCAFSHSMHFALWAYMYPNAVKENPSPKCLSDMKTCWGDPATIKYSPHRRMAEIVQAMKKKRVPPLYAKNYAVR